MKTKQISMLALATLLALSSCKKDKDQVPTPTPIDEGEVITTMIITFTDPSGIQPQVIAMFRDPDGEGGQAPDIYDTIRLASNTTYTASITLLNESVNPADNISNEVLEEADEHLFCFFPSLANLSILRTDSDDNGFQIGLQSEWTTGNISTGSTQIVLKHQPGIKDGNCSPGETDIDVTFVTEIQ